jgi:hypothetical protein
MSFNVTSTISQNNEIFRQKLEALDLESIAQALMHPEHGVGWNRQQVDRAIARYKMFLYIVFINPDSAIVPTREIDIVWHHHILNTRKYACDCQWLFGYFVHHSPNFDSETETEQLSRKKGFCDIKTLFAQTFGVTSIFEEIDKSQSACAILYRENLQQASACINLCASYPHSAP